MFDMISKRFVLHLAGGALLLSSVVAVAAQQPAKKPAAQPKQPAQTQPAPVAKKTPAPVSTATGDVKAPARPAATPAAGMAAAAKSPWSVKVSKSAPVSITLSSKNGKLTEIAADISKRLKVPVILTPLMQKQVITQEFEALPLEGALRLLAPQVFVDYELSGDPGKQPKVVAVYLQGMNEEPPAETAVVKGGSEAILIEGNTEDGMDAENVKDEAKQPLSVSVEKNQLSVHARKQPLTAVLYEIASKVDIPFEMKYESTELVDVDFSNYTMEQAVRAISPNVILYQRTNLSNYEVRPLRLVLVSPSNNQQTTKM
ncbi:MAG TPA: hypothetical protein VJ842_08030 [Pyrinomonadaceae bacterium]|nr:hypothetical protein [Pyrinomonadaceae bacterium]